MFPGFHVPRVPCYQGSMFPEPYVPRVPYSIYSVSGTNSQDPTAPPPHVLCSQGSIFQSNVSMVLRLYVSVLLYVS